MTPTAEDPQAPSDEQEQPQPQGDYGKDFIDLPRQLVDLVAATIREFQGQEKYSRRREVLLCRKLMFYDMGYQHLNWRNSGGGCFTLASPGGILNSSDGASYQCPTFMDAYNIFSAFFQILLAVMTQNLPGVNAQPLDGSNPDDIQSAKMSESYAEAFDRMNDINMLQADVWYSMAMSGRTVSWTRTETDAEKFGYNDDGTPRTFQRTTIHNTLETKVPILVNEFGKDMPYVIIYLDKDILVLKAENPAIREKIKAGASMLGENAYERTARLGVLNGSRSQSQTGDSLTHMSTEGYVWLRPSAFESEGYDVPCGEVPGAKDCREAIAQIFGDDDGEFNGACFRFVGDEYAGAYAQSADDHIDIQFPFPGKGQFRKAYMVPIAITQDNLNDMVNGAREGFDTGWPELYFDAEDQDLDAVRSQRSAANAIRSWKLTGNAAKMQDAIYQTKQTELSPTFMQVMEMMQGPFPEFLIGSPPALIGTDDEHNETAKGMRQALTQALGRLGIPWGRMQRMFARIRYQSALAAAKCEEMQGKTTFQASGGKGALVVDLDILRKGNFGWYPDEDSSFPESTQQKRATFQALVQMSEQSPMIAQMLNNPDNVATAKRYLGLDELVFIQAEARDKQLTEIEKLLQEAPIGWISDPDQLLQAQQLFEAATKQAQAAGLPAAQAPAPNSVAALQPSVPIDPGFDYNQFEFEKCKEWLSSAACREELAKTPPNLPGVMNVKAHGMAHEKAAMMQALQAQQQAATAAPQPIAHKPPAPPPHTAPPAQAPAGGPQIGA